MCKMLWGAEGRGSWGPGTDRRAVGCIGAGGWRMNNRGSMEMTRFVDEREICQAIRMGSSNSGPLFCIKKSPHAPSTH